MNFNEVFVERPVAAEKHGWASSWYWLGGGLDVFETITSEPVAAASLGQVYKATLKEPQGVEACPTLTPCR
eukprot:6201095-Amphidinium_carterae.1